MDIKTLATMLLVGRLISYVFIINVLRRQWKLRKTRIHPRLMNIRKVLAFLAILVFIGNIYPFLLDAFTLIQPHIRQNQKVDLVGVFYTLDNNLTFLVASVLIYTLYKLSDVVIEVAELISGKPIRIPNDN